MTAVAVALIGGFSAFKPASNSKLLTYRYANNGVKYVLAPTANPSIGCGTTNPHECVITTDVNKGSEFEYADIPEDAQPVEGSSPAIYNQ